MEQIYFNGKFVPAPEAKVSVMTNSLHYGTAVFEGIRAYWNAPKKQLFIFRMPEHYQRFLRNTSLLRLKVNHGVEELCDITLELLRKNHPEEDVYIRPLAFFSTETVGVRLHGMETGLAIFSIPFGPYIDVSKGVRVGISSWRRIDDNTIPARCKIAGGYVNSAVAKSEALDHGYDEAVFLTKDGFVSEGSAENIFLVRGGKLITPTLAEDILEGITRSTLIDLCRVELNLEVVERQIGRSELYLAEEIFLCGTGAQVSPVIEVDRRPIGSGEIGPITAEIQKLYFEVVKGNSRKYLKWCLPIY
jgi:branched-chain amino acid aminotransferase